MSRFHLLLLCSALPLVACDGGGGPTGPIRSYVVSEASVPTTTMAATEFGLDLNGDKIVDNQLGAVLAALSSQGFNVQTAVTKAIKEGSIILLVQFQSDKLDSGTAGLSVKLGDMPMPAACTGTTDTVCGHHLDGTGSFVEAANSPQNAAVTGKIVGGTFNGGPGDITLEIALGGTTPIQLDLIGARAKASGLSETGIDSLTVGGALTVDDLNTKVIPAIYAQISPLVTADCPGTTPPTCGCATGSTGSTILNLFDTTPKDCKITVDEIANNTLIKSLLAPDVTIEGKMALSLGLKVKTVKATLR